MYNKWGLLQTTVSYLASAQARYYPFQSELISLSFLIVHILRVQQINLQALSPSVALPELSCIEVSKAALKAVDLGTYEHLCVHVQSPYVVPAFLGAHLKGSRRQKDIKAKRRQTLRIQSFLKYRYIFLPSSSKSGGDV